MSVVWLASLILAQGVAPDAQVVFAARFYYPPHDNRISKHRVYVSRLDGTKRRQISTGTANIYSVAWLGRDRLVWVENETLVIHDLATAKVVKRFAAKNAWFYDSPERGIPRPWGDERLLEPNGAIRSRAESETLSLWDAGALKLGTGEILRFSGDNEKSPWKYSLDGREMSIKFQGTPHRVYKGLGQYAHVQTFTGGGSAGSENRLYSLDPQNARARLLIDDIDGLDFDPNSPYWSGFEPWRPMSPYGKGRNVWTQQLFVGSIKSGKRWAIAKGLVYGTSIQIRPNK